MLIHRPTPEQMQPVEALRVQIAELQTQVKQVRALPPSADEISERVADVGSHGTDEVHRNALRKNLLADKFSAVQAFQTLSAMSPAGMVALCMGDALAAGLTRLCADSGDGITSLEREQRLRDLGAELDRLEREEERLLDAMEVDGYIVRRRPDARPEIVLGT